MKPPCKSARLRTGHGVSRSVCVFRRAMRHIGTVLLVTVLVPLGYGTNSDCRPGPRDDGDYLCRRPAANSIPDISSTGTVVAWEACLDPSNDDCRSAAVALPTPFMFYGVEYNNLYISTNGYISFVADASQPVDGTILPDPNVPNAAAYAYGDNLDPTLGGTVFLSSADSCIGERDLDSCLIVQWDSVPLQGAPSSAVTAQLALNFDTSEILIEVEREEDPSGLSPQVIGTENADGSIALSFIDAGASDARAATVGDRFLFAHAPTPPPIEMLTSAWGEGRSSLEWDNPPDAHEGTLILRRSGAEVVDTPVDGTRYVVGDTIGDSTVACVAAAADRRCDDEGLANDLEFHYSAFSFDIYDAYSLALPTDARPRDTAVFPWGERSTSLNLLPPAVIPGTAVATVGDDQRLGRLEASDGTRGPWSPISIPGTVADRPIAADITPDLAGSPTDTAFLTTSEGILYRYSLDPGSSGAPEASADVLADAACTGGSLASAPALMIDGLEDNNNQKDDIVAVITSCANDDNKVLMYSHDLALIDIYDGDDSSTGGTGATLGRSVATPHILYRSPLDNLLYIPLYEDGDDNESLLVIRVNWNTGLWVKPIFSEVKGLGDIACTPDVFTFGTSNNRFVIFGNTAGNLYMYDAISRVSQNAPAALKHRSTFNPNDNDGAIRGVSVSGPIQPSGTEHWVAWTTDSLVHGLKVQNGATFKNSSHWSTALVTGPSAPLVVDAVGGSTTPFVYVGSSDGYLYELDIFTGDILNSWLVDAGSTLSEPILEQTDGGAMRLMVTTSSGEVHSIALPKCVGDADGDGTLDCEDQCNDADGDGYGSGPSCIDLDCDDREPTCTTNCTEDLDGDGTVDCLDTCIDADGDGFGDPGGAGDTCFAADCDDSRATCEADCTTDLDADGLTDCADTCIDRDGDGYGDPGGAGDSCTGADCDDSVASCDTECSRDLDLDGTSDCADSCIDADGDGYGSAGGAGLTCTGPDCDDGIATCFDDCSSDIDLDGTIDCADTCIDADGDGYGSAGGAGDTCLGTDCDDNDPTLPQCENKQCGDNGCGGVCGECGPSSVCNTAFECECVPVCDGKTCGDDGCGGSCGSCAVGEICDSLVWECCTADSDSDGVCDANDCNPNDAGVFSIPPEVEGLSIDADTETLRWNPQDALSGSSTVFDLMRGLVSELPIGGGSSETCLGSELTTNQGRDSERPNLGMSYYYLVRGENSCGIGSYGRDSASNERTSSSCP